MTGEPGEPEPITEEELAAYTEAARRYEPPFDGRPCPACPTLVRGLLATVHNYLGAADRMDPPERIQRKLAEMRAAHGALQRIADQHFADPFHAHGRPPTLESAKTIEEALER